MYYGGLQRGGAIESRVLPDQLTAAKSIRIRQARLPMIGTDRLKSAFVQALGIPATSDFDALAYGVTQGWDSVAHMNLVAEIESTFDVMFSTEDVIDMSSFAKAKEIVAKHGVDLSA